jgi:hypothetical protein
MEKIKERLSEVAHNWSYIGMITLFLFTVQPGPTASQALTVEPTKSYGTTKERNLREVQQYCIQAF